MESDKKENNNLRLEALEKMRSSSEALGGSESSRVNEEGETSTKAGSIRPVVKLDAKGRAYFEALVDFLDGKGLLESVDTLLLTMLAKNLTLWRSIVVQINSVDDVVQTFENGTSNVTGLSTAKERAEASILKLSSKLGLSPLDRAKLFGAATSANLSKQKQSDGDDLDGFLK